MKNKINLMLAVVGVFTIGIFLENTLASSFTNGNYMMGNNSFNERRMENFNIENSNVTNSNVEGYVKDGVQTIKFDLSSYSYPNLQVKVGMPVRLIVNATEESLNGCNYIVLSSALGFQKELEVGENIIEFVPKEAGEYTYSCWMGMLGAYINVVDEDITPTATFGENLRVGGCCAR